AVNLSAQKIENGALSVNMSSNDGSYSVASRGGQTIFTSRTGVQLDHVWTRSTDYPRHEVSESKFSDELGSGRSVTLKNAGLADKPDLIATIQVYENAPYATLRLEVENHAKKTFELAAARALDAPGECV